MTMYLLRHLTQKSYPSIGMIMKRDHTTVFHGVRNIERLSESDDRIAAAIVNLESRVIDLHNRG